MEEAQRALIERHITAFNEGVGTGDFGPMLDGFADDAELEFVGVPVGPFRGKDEISAAYARQPPTDRVRVLDAGDRDGSIVVAYAWSAEPERRAGEMIFSTRAGEISRLVVTFAPAHSRLEAARRNESPAR